MPGLRNKSVSAGVLILLSLALLVLPLRWMLAATVAAAFHELCHWAAVWLCGGEIADFRLGSIGAVMEAKGLSKGKALFCSLAGPLGSLLLLLTARWFPIVAVCALLQTAYNLLPILPLDGGHALQCAAELLLPPKAAAFLTVWVEKLFLGLVFLAALYAAVFLKLGIMPLILALAIFVRKNSLQTQHNKSTIDLP